MWDEDEIHSGLALVSLIVAAVIFVVGAAAGSVLTAYVLAVWP